MEHTYFGDFEAHITLQNYTTTQKTYFLATANQLKVKPIVIELARGDVPIQPMTCSFHRGELAEVKIQVEQLAEALEKAGFSISRKKIEASPFNQHIPQNNTEIAQHSPHNYFEHHIKIQLSPQTTNDLLLQLCEKYQAHLSKNAFKTTENGFSEHFITLRHYGLGLAESGTIFLALQEDLVANHYPVLKKITEYCVSDTKVEIDNNWLTTNCLTCENACMKNEYFKTN